MTLERDVEKYLIQQVEKEGGETRKLQWIGRSHAPDRCVLLRGLHLVELKKPGKQPRAGQFREFARFISYGVKVWVIDTKAKVDHFLKSI